MFIIFFSLALALNANTPAETFKALALKYYAQQAAETQTTNTSSQDSSSTSEETGGTDPNEPPAPKTVQFAQRDEPKTTTFKQVDGANNGGATSTPDKDLAAWYSTPVFDIPTEASWLSDPTYDPGNLTPGFEAATAPVSASGTTNSAAPNSSKQAAQQSGASGGGGSGGGGMSAHAEHEHKNASSRGER